MSAERRRYLRERISGLTVTGGRVYVARQHPLTAEEWGAIREALATPPPPPPKRGFLEDLKRRLMNE